MLASRRDRLLRPGSLCRATPAHDARGTFENACCSCTPSRNNHQLVGASRHLHAQCPKVEALRAVCCWSQDRPSPETGGWPPSVCLEHRIAPDDWWAQRRFSPDVREQLDPRHSQQYHIGQCLLGGSSVRNMRVPGPVPGWDGKVRPNEWSRERGGCECLSQRPVSILVGLATRGSHRRAVLRFVTLGWHSEGHHVPHVSRYIICVPRWRYSRYTDEEICHGRRMEGGGGDEKKQILPVFSSLYPSLEGSAPSGDGCPSSQRATSPNDDVRMDGQMQRRPEVGASSSSLSALAAFFKLIETRLSFDQPATRFTSLVSCQGRWVGSLCAPPHREATRLVGRFSVSLSAALWIP